MSEDKVGVSHLLPPDNKECTFHPYFASALVWTQRMLREIKYCSPQPPQEHLHICWESGKIFCRSAYLQTISVQPITGISVSSHSQANHKVIRHFSRRHFTGMKNKSIPKVFMQEAHLKTVQDWIEMPVAYVACKIIEAK